MTKWNNGMIGFQALQNYSLRVYDFYVDEGVIKKIHCYDYLTGETKFQEIFNPLLDQIISEEYFEEAFTVFCNTHESSEIIQFLELIEKDYLVGVAEEILYKYNHDCAVKTQELSKAVWEMSRKKQHIS